MLLAASAAVALFILYLYGLLVFASLVAAFGADHTWTLRHYQVIFTDGRKAIIDTLIIALVGMPLGGLYGVLVGYLVARGPGPGRQAMEIVSMINYALARHHRRHRLSDRIQRSADRANRHGADHHCLLRVPLQPAGIRTTIALMQQIDTSLEEASRSLGAAQRYDLPACHPAVGDAGIPSRLWAWFSSAQ